MPGNFGRCSAFDVVLQNGPAKLWLSSVSSTGNVSTADRNYLRLLRALGTIFGNEIRSGIPCELFVDFTNRWAPCLLFNRRKNGRLRRSIASSSRQRNWSATANQENRSQTLLLDALCPKTLEERSPQPTYTGNQPQYSRYTPDKPLASARNFRKLSSFLAQNGPNLTIILPIVFWRAATATFCRGAFRAARHSTLEISKLSLRV
jgi:hypothetical protein